MCPAPVGAARLGSWRSAEPTQRQRLDVLLDHADRLQNEAADPRVPGFVTAVAGALTHPDVAAVLAVEQTSLRSGLLPWMERARDCGQVRTDWSAEQAISWVLALEDGFIGAIATGGLPAEQAPGTLRDVIHRALRPTAVG